MENEIFFGHFQYIRCMALIHDGGERRTPAVCNELSQAKRKTKTNN